jgi:hypothetical protein
MSISDKYRQFARDLVLSKELDPMYDFAYQTRKAYDHQWSAQFLLHLFMYYDAGQAVSMAKANTELDFWHMQNYGYEGFKRGTERRHFRGDKGRQALLKFQQMGSPASIWRKMYRPTYTQLVENIERNFDGCQIGPYFTWKLMDILDRCLDEPVFITMDEAIKYLPDSPRKCAKTVYPEHNLKEVLEGIVSWIDDIVAPGAPSRNCGIPEAETIMCAIRGLEKGTYRFGEDIDLRHTQLKGLPEAEFLPPKQDWKQYGTY